MKIFPITAIILTFNEEVMLPHCLKTLAWCQEILVIDSGSTDRTTQIAEDFGAKVISDHSQSFSRRRNLGLKTASMPYLFYVDADERVTPKLAQEIMVNIETKTASVFQLRRQNIFFGQTMMAGGWQSDVLPRVFAKSAITTWEGDVHESPQYLGQPKVLVSPLLHLTHRSVSDGLKKTIVWTNLEAQLLAKSGQVRVQPLTVIRKFTMEFLRRYIMNRGFRDREVGFMESWIQAINKALIYIQVWQISHQKDIDASYERVENNLTSAWQNEEIK